MDMSKQNIIAFCVLYWNNDKTTHVALKPDFMVVRGKKVATDIIDTF